MKDVNISRAWWASTSVLTLFTILSVLNQEVIIIIGCLDLTKVRCAPYHITSIRNYGHMSVVLKSCQKYGGEGTNHIEGRKAILEVMLPTLVGIMYSDKSQPMANFHCHTWIVKKNGSMEVTHQHIRSRRHIHMQYLFTLSPSFHAIRQNMWCPTCQQSLGQRMPTWSTMTTMA